MVAAASTTGAATSSTTGAATSSTTGAARVFLLAVSAIFLAKATNEYVLGPIGKARCYAGTAEVKSLAACMAAYPLLGIEEFDPEAGPTDDEHAKRCALCGGCEPKVDGNKVAKFGTTGDKAQYICKVSECTIETNCGLKELQNEDGAPEKCFDTHAEDGTTCGTTCGDEGEECVQRCYEGNCLEFKIGDDEWEGKKECPEGYSPIQAFENDVDVRNDCKAAADFLGKDFYDDFDKAPESGDPWVCTLCGGCPQDEKPIKFGKNGDMAKWVCKKDAEASARRQLTNRLVMQLEN